MKQDRFLLGILIGIVVLVALALLAFFLRPTGLQYGADDTPEGALRNFVVAIHLQDYEKAYGYLAEDNHKPTLNQFSEPFQLTYLSPANIGLEILETNISGDKASVLLGLIHETSDPFASSYRINEQASLLRQEGQWKIRQMPHPFWYYDWYQQPHEEIKP